MFSSPLPGTMKVTTFSVFSLMCLLNAAHAKATLEEFFDHVKKFQLQLDVIEKKLNEKRLLEELMSYHHDMEEQYDAIRKELAALEEYQAHGILLKVSDKYIAIRNKIIQQLNELVTGLKSQRRRLNYYITQVH